MRVNDDIDIRCIIRYNTADNGLSISDSSSILLDAFDPTSAYDTMPYANDDHSDASVRMDRVLTVMISIYI